MSLEGVRTDLKTFQESQAYANDPANNPVPDESHSLAEIGKTSFNQSQIGDIQTRLGTVESQTASADQKAALDGNPSLNAGNPVASLADITGGLGSAAQSYVYRTAIDSPADGEVKTSNVDPALAGLVRIANIDNAGLNVSNILMQTAVNDVITLQAVVNGDMFYNFEVTGTPIQFGGSGSGGYVEFPVTLFSQGGTQITASTLASATVHFDASNSNFLGKANNLSDLVDATAGRTNLNVYSTGEVDGLVNARLVIANNLSDLANLVTARTNLDVYSVSETDSAISAAIGGIDLSAYTENANNLSDLTNTVTARSNLGVYSIGETDSAISAAVGAIDFTPYTENANNLSDLANLATSRTNLDVYSKGEVNSLLSGLGAGDMLSANNLSDVADPAAARSNLSVYSTAQVYTQTEVDNLLTPKLNATGGTATTLVVNWGNFSLDYDSGNDRVRIRYSGTEIFQLTTAGALKAKSFEVIP